MDDTYLAVIATKLLAEVRLDKGHWTVLRVRNLTKSDSRQ